MLGAGSGVFGRATLTDQPKHPSPVGITSNIAQVKAQAAQAKSVIDPVISAERRASYNQGKHDANWQKLFIGAGFAYASMIIAFVLMMFYGAATDNNERAKRFLTAREIEHMKLIEDDAHPVVDIKSKPD